MWCLYATDIAGFLAEMAKREQEFNKRCELAGPEMAAIMREERRKEYEDEKAHRRALEIAEAGRARNFWGN